MKFQSLIPELTVTDLKASKGFYLDVLGFQVEYSRPDDGFLFLSLEGNQIMLEAYREGNWVTGELEYPLGRGVNFEMAIQDVEGLYRRVEAAGISLFRPLKISQYRVAGKEVFQKEFLVQDPDGYLLRFTEG